jgi:hypothetical protein
MLRSGTRLGPYEFTAPRAASTATVERQVLASANDYHREG